MGGKTTALDSAEDRSFRQAAPTARVVELDTSSHHVFIAREDATVKAIGDFLEGISNF